MKNVMNATKMTRGADWTEIQPLKTITIRMMSFFRSIVAPADPDVFYFSLNGMVMPLSYRA